MRLASGRFVFVIRCRWHRKTFCSKTCRYSHRIISRYCQTYSRCDWNLRCLDFKYHRRGNWDTIRFFSAYKQPDRSDAGKLRVWWDSKISRQLGLSRFLDYTPQCEKIWMIGFGNRGQSQTIFSDIIWEIKISSDRKSCDFSNKNQLSGVLIFCR